ncbi:Crp/Fnr family transcriptional regulator [Chryseobacterium daeguense]|uniref:Crp/Fnr family transcriptional regulator n=1 Tax=Chryseobacterium daeguense TaxID=412438 RepID=UPI00040B5D01|nr:Crp/Fnr family transcriptional regulator [Chryseobacterium daeguense]
MIINEDLLLEFGAVYEDFDVNQTIFTEGKNARYYFQIVEGIVELNNYHEDGKEFTQNIFSNGESIGECFLLNDKPYSITAVAKTKCRILKISKPDFIKLLNAKPDVSLDLFKCLADRLSDKYFMLFNLVSQDPTTKIESVINYFKRNSKGINPFSFQVPLTRQQLANLTGLRVETVIRTIKKMEDANKVRIQNRRIFC